MRLLNVDTEEFEEFEDASKPPYAILSHTWRDEEVTFQDMSAGLARSKKGYAKIRWSCNQAKSDALQYVWVDTCCIDKRSSSELSEAINSMYRWYQQARCCYVLLDDYFQGGDGPSEPRINPCGHSSVNRVSEPSSAFCKDCFSRCRWLTRGWTLQELLAPTYVKFYDGNWTSVGYTGLGGNLLAWWNSGKHLGEDISEITGIPIRYVNHKEPVSTASIAQRFSWASKRQTARTEDLAYCLMGLFDVNMPLLYGEGSKSFIRLQEEIMKANDDQSVFACGLDRLQAGLCWVHPRALELTYGSVTPMLLMGSKWNMPLLAPSSACFLKSSHIIPCKRAESNKGRPHTMTNRGLSIDIHFLENNVEMVDHPWSSGTRKLANVSYVVLGCVEENNPCYPLTLAVRAMESNVYVRMCPDRPLLATVAAPVYREASLRSVYLIQKPGPYRTNTPNERFPQTTQVLLRSLPENLGVTLSTIPSGCWNETTRVMHVGEHKNPAMIIFQIINDNLRCVALTVMRDILEHSWFVKLETVTLPISIEEYARERPTGGLQFTRVGETPSRLGETFYEASIAEDPVVGGVYALSLRYNKSLVQRASEININ